MKRNAENLLQLLKPISVTLDKLQSDKVKISDAVFYWKQLELSFTGTNLTTFKKRYEAYIGEAHFAAFLLSPRYVNSSVNLSNKEYELAMSYIEENFTINFPSTVLLKFKGQVSPFRPSMFSSANSDSSNSSTLSDYKWWQSIRFLDNEKILKDHDADKIYQLMTAIASSSGVERTFSKFNLVHSKLRNKLGVQKAAKLVFISQQLNA